MKIAFVFPPMWSPHSDGSLQIWNREITKRLAEQCDVLVYSGKFGSSPNDRVEGVRYRCVSTRLDNRFLSRFHYFHIALGVKRPFFSTDLWYAAYATKIALDLRKRCCDVVHIYNYPQFAQTIRRFNPKLPIVLNMHGEWLTQIAFTDLRARLREIDLIVSCSDFITKSTAETFAEVATRCRTVPMGISSDAFAACDNRRESLGTSRRLLYVGRISPEKGVHVLLDAFESICTKYSDASLTIVGPEAVAPREHIVDLSLDKSLVQSLVPFYESGYLQKLRHRLSPYAARRVTFTGLVTHDRIPEHYAAADIYINPSLYESFGMSIIEAMAAGLPVVTTRVGAVPDLISHKRNGLLVDTADPTAIADAVIELFRNDELRISMSRTSCETIRKQFSWDTICSTLMRAYGGLRGSHEVAA